MTRHILIIQGHPDPDRKRYGYRLSDAYKVSAEQSGFQVREIYVADISFELVKSYNDFYQQPAPVALRDYQQHIDWADHLVIFYPLWLGGMPALLKGFFEQVLRPGFAFEETGNKLPGKLLKGKSARVVVTMGMPALVYRWFYRAHSLKSLKRNILNFCGISPVRSSLIGLVGIKSATNRERWIKKMQRYGREAK